MSLLWAKFNLLPESINTRTHAHTQTHTHTEAHTHYNYKQKSRQRANKTRLLRWSVWAECVGSSVKHIIDNTHTSQHTHTCPHTAHHHCVYATQRNAAQRAKLAERANRLKPTKIASDNIINSICIQSIWLFAHHPPSTGVGVAGGRAVRHSQPTNFPKIYMRFFPLSPFSLVVAFLLRWHWFSDTDCVLSNRLICVASLSVHVCVCACNASCKIIWYRYWQG